MSWRLRPQEKAAVLAQTPAKRVEYSMKKFADEAQLWSLRAADGWVMMATADGAETIPVWPHAEFAKESATGRWSDAHPASIELDEWMT